jgi:hypothetical protein
MPLPDPDLRTRRAPDGAGREPADRPADRLVGITARVHADIGADGTHTPPGRIFVTWPGTSFPVLTRPDPPAHT